MALLLLNNTLCLMNTLLFGCYRSLYVVIMVGDVIVFMLYTHYAAKIMIIVYYIMFITVCIAKSSSLFAAIDYALVITACKITNQVLSN